jgi:hypothetical protein
MRRYVPEAARSSKSAMRQERTLMSRPKVDFQLTQS